MYVHDASHLAPPSGRVSKRRKVNADTEAEENVSTTNNGDTEVKKEEPNGAPAGPAASIDSEFSVRCFGLPRNHRGARSRL